MVIHAKLETPHATADPQVQPFAMDVQTRIGYLLAVLAYFETPCVMVELVPALKTE